MNYQCETHLGVVVLVLAAAERDEAPCDDDGHDADDEGEDGGEQEDLPLALLQILIDR